MKPQSITGTGEGLLLALFATISFLFGGSGCTLETLLLLRTVEQRFLKEFGFCCVVVAHCLLVCDCVVCCGCCLLLSVVFLQKLPREIELNLCWQSIRRGLGFAMCKTKIIVVEHLYTDIKTITSLQTELASIVCSWLAASTSNSTSL